MELRLCIPGYVGVFFSLMSFSRSVVLSHPWERPLGPGKTRRFPCGLEASSKYRFPDGDYSVKEQGRRVSNIRAITVKYREY